MTKIQEEMIKADEDDATEAEKGVDVNKMDRRNMSKSTNLSMDPRNQPKLLDDGSKGLGYNSF